MSENAAQGDKQEYYDDEISLKELILKLQEFWRELWKNWWLIVLVCIPFIIYFLYKHSTHVKTYTADLTFMINEDEGGGGLGGMSSVLGSFGLGGATGGEYNLEKMLSLLKSRKIVQEVLMQRDTLDGVEDLFANHLIKCQNLHEKWAKSKGDVDLSNFLFNKTDFAKFTIQENTALKYIHALLIGNAKRGLNSQLNSNISDDTGIMNISMNSRDEQLSIDLIEALFVHLSDYYVSKSIEKQLNSYNIVAAKADSLQSELRSAEYALANFVDTNRGLYNRKDQLQQYRLEAQVKMLGTAYAKVIEQKEIAEFSLNDQTPVVQIIDYPISPLEPSRSSLIKNLIIACLIGGFLGAAFIIGRKILRDTLA